MMGPSNVSSPSHWIWGCSRAKPSDTGLVDALTEARAEIQGVIDGLRDLARGIHPVVLTDHGLRAALDHLAEISPTPLTVSGMLNHRLPEPVETTVYRVVVESAKTGPTSVRLDRRADRLRLEVEMPDLPPNLVELADRVGAVGGEMDVDVISSGSRIVADIPCG